MVKEKVFVLRAIKFREADLILHCLNRHGARLSFIARSALKSKKRFSGGILEPINFIEVNFKSRSEDHGKLIVLDGAQLIEGFSGLRSDYDRLDMCLHILDTVNKVAQEGESHAEELFNLLGHFLRKAETSKNLQQLKMHFQLKFLYQQGVLNIEPWMAEFLRHSIVQSDEIQLSKEELSRHSVLINSLTDQFVATAEIN